MATTRFKGFIGNSYTLRNNRFDCQRTVNLYAEVDESGMGKNGEIAQLTRTPGLTQLVSANGNAGKCLYTAGTGNTYYYAGNTLYKVNGVDGSASGWTLTTIGSSAVSGNVTMTDNGQQLFVAGSKGGGFSYDFTTLAIASITTISPSSCTFYDGYVVLSEYGTNKFYWTDLYTTTVPALNFASAESNSDAIVGVINNNQDLWIFGKKTIELWYDAGQGNVVFARRPGILIETGCAAIATVRKTNTNQMIWMALDDRGGPVIVTNDGYSPRRISTFALEQQWTALTEAQIAGATAYVYAQDGHTFYCLNVPGLSSTWVYDVTTSQQLQQSTWHERTYTSPTTGAQSRHLAESHMYAYNKHIVSDYSTGALYFFDQDGYTDNGNIIKRMRVSPHISNSGSRLKYNNAVFDFKTGSGDFVTADPQIMLRYSNDGGQTWSNILQKSVGAVGAYNTRVKFYNLGIARDRVFELSLTDPVDWAVSGASLDIDPTAF